MDEERDETESTDKDVRTEGIERMKERKRKREGERRRRTKRRNEVREKKGSNSFSFSSLIRLVNRLFWRSRRSHNRATSLLRFRGEEANGNTATIDARRLVCSRRPVLQGAFSLIAPHGYPTCVPHSREIAPAILSAFLRPAFSRCLSSSRFGRFSATRARVNVFRMVVVVVPIVCELFEMISNSHCAVNCHLCCQSSTSFEEKRNGAKIREETVR